MTPIRGSCLRGGIQFEIDRPVSAALNCRCSQCRKQHGAVVRYHRRSAAIRRISTAGLNAGDRRQCLREAPPPFLAKFSVRPR